MVWNGMEKNFSMFLTGNFIPFYFHSIPKIFHSVLKLSLAKFYPKVFCCVKTGEVKVGCFLSWLRWILKLFKVGTVH